MNQAIEQAKARAEQGIMPPKWVYPYVINDARNVITGAPFDSGPDAPLFADFTGKVGKLNISQIEKDVLVADAAQASNANANGEPSNHTKRQSERIIARRVKNAGGAGFNNAAWS
jgi:hypothetical protein